MSGTLARPWQTIPGGRDADALAASIANLLMTSSRDNDLDPLSFSAVVVGVPRRLNGEATHMTKAAEAVASRLGELTGLAVHLQDERLTSREAEARLAATERDWRKRKSKLDAAAAAIILQDFLDARAAARATQPGGM